MKMQSFAMKMLFLPLKNCFRRGPEDFVAPRTASSKNAQPQLRKAIGRSRYKTYRDEGKETIEIWNGIGIN